MSRMNKIDLNGAVTRGGYREPNERRLTMNESETQKNFVVQCIWCGAKIRDDNEEETTGVCLQCFYEILNHHLHAQKQTVYGEFVSDR